MMVVASNYPLHKSLVLKKKNYKPRHLLGALLLLTMARLAPAQRQTTVEPPEYGPYNGIFLADGLGLRVPLANVHDSVLLADSPWSIYCWIRPSEEVKGQGLIAGLGNVSEEYARFLSVSPDNIFL